MQAWRTDLNWQKHEQPDETHISLDIDTVLSDSLLSAWTNAQTDLSKFGLQAILLVWVFKNVLRFMEMITWIRGMMKIMTLNIANALCEYRIIFNV